MTQHLKKLLFLLLIVANQLLFGQNASNNIFTEFNLFFDAEIKHQGIKGDWIFKLNEITGNHKFDYNNDGFNDVLMEFNAVPLDGGGVTYYFAVLFENDKNNSFKFVNYLNCEKLVFKLFNEPSFTFTNTKYKTTENFVLVNSKFIKSSL